MSIPQLCAHAHYCVAPRLTKTFIILSILLISATAALGSTLDVPAGGDLQAAINSAAPGDTIVVQAGATYQGPFTLTAKPGESFITIQSSRASEITGRVSPSQSNLLAMLRSNVVAEPVIKTVAGAHHYQLIGLDISTVSASDFAYDLVRLGDSEQTDLSTVPHDLVLDRVWIHGFDTQELQRGVSLNSAETSIVNSYISEIHAVAIDTQAICGWNGPGPYHIVNNYLEAAAENIMFGGSDPKIPNLVPSDIEIRGNYLFKPLTWKVDDPSYLGRHWEVKNLLELKNARSVTIDGNILENNWLDAQTGVPVVFTARNQDGTAPWSTVEYVSFTNNTVRNTQGGVNILKTDAESNGAITSNVAISNNLFDGIGTYDAFLLLNGPDNIQITHNTVFKGGNVVTMDADPSMPKGTGLVIQDNLFSESNYGIFGSNIGEGTPALQGYFASYVCATNNVAGREGDLYPSGNTFVPTSQVGFVDLAGGDYRLASSSAFKNAASDGKDVGVDMDALLAAQNSTTQPNPTPTPTPAPVSTPIPTPTPAPSGGETVLLADDFNDASLDTSKWVANDLFSGFTDSTVALAETTTLEIGQLKQNTDGSHYNGIRSVAAFDFTGAYAYVQLVQAPNALTAADAFYTIGLDVDNCYRMYVESGNLILQRKIGGTKSILLTVPFDATNNAFWRIRHDAISGQVVFDTAPNNGGAPGTWTQLYAEAWDTSAVPLSSVMFELKGGTWRIEGSDPGAVIFDNFKAARP